MIYKIEERCKNKVFLIATFVELKKDYNGSTYSAAETIFITVHRNILHPVTIFLFRLSFTDKLEKGSSFHYSNFTHVLPFWRSIIGSDWVVAVVGVPRANDCTYPLGEIFLIEKNCGTNTISLHRLSKF